MTTSDDLVRAEARALIRVLHHYKVARGSADLIWREVETFAYGCGTAGDLRTIGRRYAGAAAAAFSGGVKLRAPDAALFLAFSAFARASHAYRFLDSSRWIALYFAFVDKRSIAETAIQNEVLERLETALAAEVSDSRNEAAFLAQIPNVGHRTHEEAERKDCRLEAITVS